MEPKPRRTKLTLDIESLVELTPDTSRAVNGGQAVNGGVAPLPPPTMFCKTLNCPPPTLVCINYPTRYCAV